MMVIVGGVSPLVAKTPALALRFPGATTTMVELAREGNRSAMIGVMRA
jgi:hypothetical protein